MKTTGLTHTPMSVSTHISGDPGSSSKCLLMSTRRSQVVLLSVASDIRAARLASTVAMCVRKLRSTAFAAYPLHLAAAFDRYMTYIFRRRRVWTAIGCEDEGSIANACVCEFLLEGFAFLQFAIPHCFSSIVFFCCRRWRCNPNIHSRYAARSCGGKNVGRTVSNAESNQVRWLAFCKWIGAFSELKNNITESIMAFC